MNQTIEYLKKFPIKNIVNEITILKSKQFDKTGEELEYIIDKLKNIITNCPISSVQYDEIINDIYTLKCFKIDFIDKFLKELNYEEILNNEYNNIYNKIKNNIKLIENDIKIYEFLSFNYVLDDELFQICNFVIKNTLNKKIVFDYEYVKKIIIYFTEKMMKNYTLNPKCIISDNKNNESSNIIYLNENSIENFYYNGSIDLILTIFHELSCLSKKYRSKKTHNITYDDILIAKDKILKELDLDFYNKNYLYIKTENEDRTKEVIFAIRYLEQLGFKIIEKNEIANFCTDELQKNAKTILKIKEKKEEISNYFDTLIYSKPELLDKYEVLYYEYKIEGNKVIRKTEEELLDDYKNLSKNNKSNESIILLYEELFLKLNEKEKSL